MKNPSDYVNRSTMIIGGFNGDIRVHNGKLLAPEQSDGHRLTENAGSELFNKALERREAQLRESGADKTALGLRKSMGCVNKYKNEVAHVIKSEYGYLAADLQPETICGTNGVFDLGSKSLRDFEADERWCSVGVGYDLPRPDAELCQSAELAQILAQILPNVAVRDILLDHAASILGGVKEKVPLEMPRCDLEV